MIQSITLPTAPPPNLPDYESAVKQFSWEVAEQELDHLPEGRGLNIAHEAVDRHVKNGNGTSCAIRWIKKDRTFRDISYRNLRELTAQFANVLTGLGIEKGQVVATLLGRVPDLYIAALGTLKVTAVFCPLYAVFGPEPAIQRLVRGRAKILLTTLDSYNRKIKPHLERLPDLKYILITDSLEDLNGRILSLPRRMETAAAEFTIPATARENPALLHFTSGTTGMPKGAVHVHGAVLTHLVTARMVLDLQPHDIFWCTADPGWVTGTSYGIIAPLLCGVTTLVDEEEFDAARWYSILTEHHVNVWYTAPTAFRRLMRMQVQPTGNFDLTHLRLILSVGEPLPADAVRWGEQTFGVPVLDNWWQTETGGIMVSNYRSMKVRPGSMGKPLPGIEAGLAAVDNGTFRLINQPEVTGHLVIKKGWPSMFRAYLEEPARYNKCFSGDWYITGDLARRDADGYYWFIGRADDLIKTSGHLVGPFEVERVLLEHPSVVEAAVIGKPDPISGELVKAFVVPKAGVVTGEVLQADIIAFARKKLGPAIAPKEVAFIQGLPKTRSGKILRRLLKARELGLEEGDLSTLEHA